MSEIELYETTWRLSQRLVQTEFVPVAFRGKPESILAAVLYGRELGMGPMQALQSVNVIQGKPTLAPEAMRGRVFSAGHTIETVHYDSEKVTLRGRRSDGAEAEVTWTLADARRAGLVKDGGAWSKYPRAMLLARATSELCRLLFPDVIAGVSYVPEEVGGEEVIDVESAEAGSGEAPGPAEAIEVASAAPSADAGGGTEPVVAPDERPSPTNKRYATWTKQQLLDECADRQIDHGTDASKLTLAALLTEWDATFEQAAEERRAEDARAVDERRAG